MSYVIPFNQPYCASKSLEYIRQALVSGRQSGNGPFGQACVEALQRQPVQLTQEVCAPIDATLNHPKRVDYEYERAGTASIFLFVEPLVAWRCSHARDRKTSPIGLSRSLNFWTLDIKPAKRSSSSATISILTPRVHSTKFSHQKERGHTPRKLSCGHTPKHGSWLNIAECELSAMTRQCLHGRRIGELQT